MTAATEPTTRYAAVVLSGGRSSRMGGDVPKPLLRMAGRPLLHHVLTALDGVPTVVVGLAAQPMPVAVRVLAEDPPGAGPAYALACGVAALPEDVDRVHVLAADLPMVTRGALEALSAHVGDGDGAVYVDGSGREQWLCGCWRADALRAAVDGVEPNAALRSVLAPLRVERVAWAGPGPPPYHDCDTPEAFAAAERAMAERAADGCGDGEPADG